MIVSHKYEFIFIKTRRTGGSSMEAALSPFLGPNDIITGSNINHTPRRNTPPGIPGHVGWRKIKAIVGEECFESYRKVCFERNSYDKAVSDWLYHRKRYPHTSEKTLLRHVLRRAPTDWDRYSESDGEHVTDTIYTYHHLNLARTFEEMCVSVGLPTIPLKFHLKKNEHRAHYSVYYKQEPLARAAVFSRFNHEIKCFGFRYEDQQRLV